MLTDFCSQQSAPATVVNQCRRWFSTVEDRLIGLVDRLIDHIGDLSTISGGQGWI
jgi:hypothetical protein